MKSQIFDRGRIEENTMRFCDNSLVNSNNWPPSIEQKPYLDNLIADSIQTELINQITPLIKDNIYKGIYQIDTAKINEIVMRHSGYSHISNTPITEPAKEYYSNCINGVFDEVEAQWDTLLLGEDVCGWFSNFEDHC